MHANTKRTGRRGLLRVLPTLILGLMAGSIQAQTTIDNTCATCGRMTLDSANLRIERVRVNQVGYRNDDPVKRGLVGNPRSTTFQVIRGNGTVAYSGTLKAMGTHPRGRMRIYGYYNSTTRLYDLDNGRTDSTPEALSEIRFGLLQETGRYRVAVGPDTSVPFDIRPNVYNDILETGMKFLGIQRSGDNDSWFHGPSHLKDGSARGSGKAGSLAGGWYDCGDHFKVGETIANAFVNLMTVYTIWPQKAEDRYGSSYNDTLPFGTDGIPDILREAKIGADFVMKLWRASKEDGLVAQHDMYHSVGINLADHSYWDRPENQDAQPPARGGPDRVVAKGIGGYTSGSYCGALALFAHAWEPFDPAEAAAMLAVAESMYTEIVLPNRMVGESGLMSFYDPQTFNNGSDDVAWAAMSLWYATAKSRYKSDLLENTAYGSISPLISNSNDWAIPAGLIAAKGANGFYGGGWTEDYHNIFGKVIYSLYKLFYETDSTGRSFGVAPAEAQDMRRRLRGLMGDKIINDATNGSVYSPLDPRLKAYPIYDLVWYGFSWGTNRYNTGMVGNLFAYNDMIKPVDPAMAQLYWDVGVSNMNYDLGTNPWNLSFLMGAGSKNQQHPHHRASNPEGYNAGGIPYEYRIPKGALMGGAPPNTLLEDKWDSYTLSETCIDFTAQLLLPAQFLAEDLPPDHEGPLFSNVVVVQVTNTTALVAWETDELSRDTLFYSLTPGGPIVGQVSVNLAKKKTAEITGLTPNTQYWFFFKGMDIYRNVSRDDNRGRYYDFTTTTTSVPPAKISDVLVCNIRSDRATVFWWTDIPSTSAVEFAEEGAIFANVKVRVDGDDEGLPGRFHKVTLKGLKPGTTYRFDAISATTRSDSGGLHHRFATIKDFASYAVQIKATNRNGASNAHFYLEVANNEPRPYVGLELRFYFQADAATARKVVIRSNDLQKFDVGGLASPLRANFGAAVAVPGIANQWYLPITLLDTLVVAGRARIEMQMTDSNYTALPLSIFQDAWSLAPHSIPMAFAGVDLANLWAKADPVEDRGGIPTVTYVKDPYIAGFSQGVHIFGYPPDGTKPKVVRTTEFRFATPLPSPATSVKQDSLAAHFTGRTWSFPDVVDAQWQVDGPLVRPDVALAGQTDSVAFRHDTLESQGTTSHEFAFWGDRDSTYCSCAWSRFTVAVDTQKVLPPRYRLEWKPDSARSATVGSRVALSLVLASDSLDTVKVAGLVALVSSKPGVVFYGSASSTTAITSLSLVNGTATVWVSSDLGIDSAILGATGTVPAALVDPALSKPVSFLERIPPHYRLVWTPDSVRSTLVGTRLAYTLTFSSDTMAVEPVAGQVLFASTLPGIQFFSSATATTPITTLSASAGSVVVYVTSSVPVDSAILHARANVLDALVDSARSRFVSFLTPPPWPRVDSAATRDVDCDGRVDRIEIFLSGAPGTSRLAGVQASLGFDSANGTASWSADSMRLTLTLAAPLSGTDRAGAVRVWWVAVGAGDRDTTVAVTGFVRDRVGPRLVSASVLENFKPATVPDTLRVEFSEPVIAPASGWPFATVLPATPVLLNGRAITPTVWEWTTAPGAAVRVDAGQILRSVFRGNMTDTLGNGPAGCGSDSAVVQLRTRPVPMRAAIVLDRDGDGHPDAIRLEYERGLRALEKPDSVRLVWADVAVTIGGLSWTRGADSSLLTTTLPIPWAASAGATSARAKAWKGSGANLFLDSISLTDSVGPSLRGAVLRFGNLTDTLILRVSEAATSGLGIELFRKQQILSQATSRTVGADGSTRLVFPAGLLQDGDSLRLSPVWIDAAGNIAAPNAPWVAVVSGDRPPVDAWLKDSDGDGRADLVVLRWDRPYRRAHGFVFTWLDNGVWTSRVTDSTNFLAVGPLEAQVVLPNPFPFGATGLGTLPGAPAVQLETLLEGFTDSLPFAVRDSVDPIVRSATVRYAVHDGDPDTLVALFSETLLLQPVLPQVVLHVKGLAKSETPVIQWVVTQSPDGRTAWLLLQASDSSQTVFDLGDSVRIAPRGSATVRDPLGNIAAGASPWVRVQFGARPSRFGISMYPYALHVSTGTILPGSEQVRVLVRARGKQEWQTLDGFAAGDVNGRIGPRISINGGFGGRVNFFDNLGTSVADVDLSVLEQAWTAGTLPADPSGQYEVWIGWNGSSRAGRIVGTGVYVVRLALRRDLAPPGEKPDWYWTNDLIRFGWKISLE